MSMFILLYPEVVKKYGTTWKAVERDIRYEIDRLKITRQKSICQLLQISSDTKLTPAKFIALLAAYVMGDSVDGKE